MCTSLRDQHDAPANYHASGSEPLAQGLTALHLGALIAGIALLTAVAVWRFDRHDIST